MVDEIYREDIISIYVKEKTMSEAQKQEVLKNALDIVKERLTRNYTPEEVISLFAHIERDNIGGLRFASLPL